MLFLLLRHCAVRGDGVGLAGQVSRPLTVDPRGVQRKNSPASVDVDLQKALAEAGAKGTFDENTIEVIGYDASGKPRVSTPLGKAMRVSAALADAELFGSPTSR